LIARLAQIDIEVGDLDSAKEFYAKVFNLKTSPAEIFGKAILEVEVGCQVGIALVASSWSPLPHREGPLLGSTKVEGQGSHLGSLNSQGIAIYFEVHDLAQTLEQAKLMRGKIAEKIRPEINGKFSWIEDPYGNRIHIFERIK
jgi:predicted enzyme related to lactoylglutathione lyase